MADFGDKGQSTAFHIRLRMSSATLFQICRQQGNFTVKMSP